jgi:hypothetical protein
MFHFVLFLDVFVLILGIEARASLDPLIGCYLAIMVQVRAKVTMSLDNRIWICLAQ